MVGINKGMSYLYSVQEQNLSSSNQAFAEQETLGASVCVHILVLMVVLDSYMPSDGSVPRKKVSNTHK